ncbi:hypothetical protein QMK33_03830 [Hymenobacter sp. H14-R3]|uniref:hypothetical protein n=1 Tax=Hymenobacter sp. H14-R3 TaxID=3046308 RepID=UPI0024B9036F|nr:hypothetical protein [Hymenobacter sp. H14-R3]MDJ0364267.1 hypothetical protein [Hymenobacter sp. H14-R3]
MSCQLVKAHPVGRPVRWMRVLRLCVAFCLLSFSVLAPVAAQPRGTLALPADTLPPVSEALVRHYLARSLSVQALNYWNASVAQRRTLINWAADAGMRMAGRTGGWWSTPNSDQALHAFIDTLQRNVQLMHARQPDIVVQGCIFELVEPHVGNLTVPNRLRAAFGEDTLALRQRRFSFANIVYPEYHDLSNSSYRWGDSPPGQAPGVPDMSRSEAQLWFYYCAVLQLDAGCEALHFGQIRLIDDAAHDPGHRAFWGLLQRIRRYARTRNRGFVLCDAHTHGEHYDPIPAAPLPDSVRQLLFDFHSFPLRPVEADTVRAGTHAAYLDIDPWGNPGGGIYVRSQGGRAPGGWLCRHLPAQAEFDNGISGTPGKPGQWPLVWGLDEISWFANQPSAYRNRWLIYAQARVRQLDPATYFQPAGGRGVSLQSYARYHYWATEAGQAETIRAIWAGETTAEGARLLLIGPSAP